MFENRRFERLLKPVKAAIVYLQCMFRDSHCSFSSMRLKSGGTVPSTPKSGVRVPPESYAYAARYTIMKVSVRRIFQETVTKLQQISRRCRSYAQSIMGSDGVRKLQKLKVCAHL